MAKPTDSPLWATDANYAADGDSWSSTATRVDPGSTRRAEGAEPDTFPAQWFNWIVGVQGDHIDYINDVLEATDKIDAVSRPIVISSADIAYDDATEWVRVDADMGGTLSSLGDDVIAYCDVGRFLPHGATLTKVRLLVTPGAARGTVADRVTLDMESRAHTFTGTPAQGSGTSIISAATDDGTANTQSIESGTLSVTIDSETHYAVRITAGNDGGGHNNDSIYALHLVFTDPGPRNF